jgi:hypothetical protein
MVLWILFIRKKKNLLKIGRTVMLTNKDDDLLLQNIISLTATDKEGIMVELVIRPECN